MINRTSYISFHEELQTPRRFQKIVQPILLWHPGRQFVHGYVTVCVGFIEFISTLRLIGPAILNRRV